MCCGFANALLAGYAGEAAAQAGTPLRVDPVLLGLPPVKPEPVPAPAAKPAPSAVKEERVEIKQVDIPVVEARPVAVPAESSRPETTVAAPASVEVPPPVQPSGSSVVQESRELGAAAAKPVPAVQAQQPPLKAAVPAPMKSSPVAASSSPKVSGMEPLRVDPVLLGLPPVVPESPLAGRPPVSSSSSSTTQSAQSSGVRSSPGGVAAPASVAPVQADARKPAASERAKSAQAAAGSGPKVSSMGPLLVDPALLGMPPLAPAAQVAGRPGASEAATMPFTGSPSDDAATDTSPALALRASKKMEPLSRDSQVPRPAFLRAQRMSGEVNREFVAEGDAELRKIGTVVNSDRLTYWPLDDELEAEGNVRLQQGEDVISGPKMRLRLEDQVGYFEQPSYQLKHQSLTGGKAAKERAESDQYLDGARNTSWWNSGFESPRTMNIKPGQTSWDNDTKANPPAESRGDAERLNFEGENQFRLLNNTYTTCPVGNNDWYLRTSELKLDYDHEVGNGEDATLYFKDVPILYSPWFSFALNNERKSGFLRPSYGTSSDNGFEFELPYYWNIAPNMDATITPRLMTKRGVQFGNEFRYLNTAFGGLYSGKLTAEYLPGDRLRDNENRYGVSLWHNQTTRNGFTGLINYNKVSDDDYYTDLSSDITSTSQTQLLQQGMLTYGGGGWWNTSINFQQYQTLQPDADNPVLEQYRMLPQITFNARKPDFYQTDLSFLGQYTNFTIREREQFGTRYPDGKRTVLYPQIALPYVTPGWYITPKFGVNYRSYSLTGQASGNPDSMSVSLPIFSLDSGMTFERASNWFGRDYTQTLEPRLYYLNIPYKDQSAIPVFDSALADFNFAQIFSENQFSGWDRINNANQLTAALTSRLIEPTSGNEIMRAMIGQRFYFTKNKVTLTSATTTSDTDKWDRSDFLAAFSGQILPKVYADTAVQYDLNDRRSERFSAGLRFQPEPGKLLNAAYRYSRDETAPLNQVDVSGQWPISGRWHAVGRLNYSFKDDGTVLSTGGQSGRIIESIAGLEYNGGCWIVRGVVRRRALTSEDASTAFYVQLELSGLGRIGSNPLSLLKRSIQGYSLISNQDDGAGFDD